MSPHHLPEGGGIILGLMVMAGCAPAIATPCRFTVDVVVDSPKAVDSACRRAGVVSHQGRAIPWNSTVRGCADADTITTINSQQVFGHEMRHIVDRNCGKQTK